MPIDIDVVVRKRGDQGEPLAQLHITEENLDDLETLIPLIERLGKLGQAFGLGPK